MKKKEVTPEPDLEPCNQGNKVGGDEYPEMISAPTTIPEMEHLLMLFIREIETDMLVEWWPELKSRVEKEIATRQPTEENSNAAA